MIYRVEVSTKKGFRDVRSETILPQIEALGVSGIRAVSVTDLYFLEGDLDQAAAVRLVGELLVDPIVEEAVWYQPQAVPTPEGISDKNAAAPQSWQIEVTLLPGVTDSVAESLLQGADFLGLTGLTAAATGQRYALDGDLDQAKVQRIVERLLVNEVIQTYTVNRPITPPFVPASLSSAVEDPRGVAYTVDKVVVQEADRVDTIPLTEADEDELIALSQERRLSLDLSEMLTIQTYYRREGREPTDVELETLAQTWSEHCVHKTFKALITYEGPGPDSSVQQEQIDSLLKTYIRGATEQVNKPWVRSAFVDNAGIVAFDDRFDLAFKVETHNHPSALEPFGGANTGIGGVIRDVIGVSARPIANTDVLCFGPQDIAFADLPDNVLHPRRIADGVTAGIEDYGNKMGIPTVNGAILYDSGYIANPLVFCGCLGLLPRDTHPTRPQVGDLVVVIGGRTGRDGLRGATFSSMEMTHETSAVAGSAVQIGHPIHEKQTMEAILLARDEGLYNAITDCGAGGLSSAIGEMSADLGADVHLERVPLKYPGLRPWEIWLSEAQERMVLAVPPANWPHLQAICRSLDIEATALGNFTATGRLNLYYGNRLVGQFANAFLHGGLPRRQLQALWNPPDSVEPDLSPPADLTAELLALLATPDTRSKEDVVRQYDHEIQGGTVVKPFVGPAGLGPSDAAILAPLDVLRNEVPPKATPRGVALAAGINPAYGAIDPYAMAWAAVDEAMRNCVAVGADPDQISLLDNFCWGNPNLPDRLGGLVRCAQGCYDAAVAYQAPFISGKDSLNNEYIGPDGQKHAIPGTLLISALGIVPDLSYTATSDLKAAGNWLYMVGLTAHELGGSTFYRHYNLLGATVPQPPPQGLALYRALHRAITGGLVRACHDCSEGGLAVAAAEMALGGGLGLVLNLADVPRTTGPDRDDVLAFSESLGRFIVEVDPEDAPAFEATWADLPIARVGYVRDDDRIEIKGLAGQSVITTDLNSVTKAWRGHLEHVIKTPK